MMRSMLPGAPWLLAHKSMLPVNQPFKVTLYGRDYVLWQDGTGTVQALPNRCPHMGAMLSEGWCEPLPDDGQSGIVCPFHALKFDGAGCTVLPGSNQKTLPIKCQAIGVSRQPKGGSAPKFKPYYLAHTSLVLALFQT